MRSLALANARTEEPLSVYVHLPFCEERCAYCGCNVVITRHRDVANEYLDYLEREIDLLAEHLPSRRRVSQLHWGGGTPTYYASEQLERVFARLAKHFTFTADAEISATITTSGARPPTIRLRWTLRDTLKSSMDFASRHAPKS